jgi:hypothetical protein
MNGADGTRDARKAFPLQWALALAMTLPCGLGIMAAIVQFHPKESRHGLGQ